VRAEYQVHRTFIPQVEQGPLKLSARPADVGHDRCQGILAMAVISRYELFQIPQYQNLALFRGNSAKHFFTSSLLAASSSAVSGLGICLPALCSSSYESRVPVRGTLWPHAVV
jgi:hypothetical protein